MKYQRRIAVGNRQTICPVIKMPEKIVLAWYCMVIVATSYLQKGRGPS